MNAFMVAMKKEVKELKEHNECLRVALDEQAFTVSRLEERVDQLSNKTPVQLGSMNDSTPKHGVSLIEC